MFWKAVTAELTHHQSRHGGEILWAKHKYILGPGKNFYNIKNIAKYYVWIHKKL
jgi:hypothetical protein